MTFLLSKFLKIKGIRDRVVSILKYKYFHELGHSIPLKNGFWAELLEIDSYDSFSEIFVQREYEDYLPSISISRVLDIGSNYGYFSLWIQSIFPENQLMTLMIEPSPRCSRTLNKLIQNNKTENSFQYLKRMVGNPLDDEGIFFDRPYMSGSSFKSSDDAEKIRIPILTEQDVKSKLPPPYDLIKCDIEGSELELLKNYPTLINRTKYLLLEWHSWHNGGAEYFQIEEQLHICNFEIIKSSPELPAVGREGLVGLILAKNLSFKT